MTLQELLREAGRMGWETTGTEAFSGYAGLRRAGEWVHAHLDNAVQYGWENEISRCRAWLAGVRVWEDS